MKSPFAPKGPRETIFTKLSRSGNGERDTGGIRRIGGFENTGKLSNTNTSERQIATIVQQTLRILENIKNGREKNLGLKDFEDIAEEVRGHLVQLGINTQKLDEAITEARRKISG